MAAFMAALMDCARVSSLIGERVILVEAYALAVFAGELLQVAFDCSGTGAFAYGGRFFIVFPLAYFSENASFFAGTLKTTQGHVEGLVFLEFDMGH
jgi:hypothetical protein